MENSGHLLDGANLPINPADLRKIRLFSELSDDRLVQVHANLKFRPVRARSTVVFRRDMPDEVACVWSGLFRVSVQSDTGGSVTLLRLGPGDAFGFVGAVLNRRPGDRIRLYTEGGGSVLHLSGGALLELAKHDPVLCTALMAELAALVVFYAGRVFELAALNVRTRLEIELYRLAQAGTWKDGRCTVTGAPTHAALAAQVGASREVVTRHLRELAKAGVLRLRRGVIEFTNHDHLRAAAQSAAGQLILHTDGEA
jgi:CRP-like cAMP-binding protein